MHKFLVGTAGLSIGALLMLPAASAVAALSGPEGSVSALSAELSETSLRVATIATTLSGENPGELNQALLTGTNREATRVAASITEFSPDLVVLTGMDADATAVDSFKSLYLNSIENQLRDVDYPYSYLAVGVKGAQSGADLDGDKVVGGAGDAWGQGAFAEQASIVVLSKYPINPDAVTSVSTLKWSAVKDNQLKDSGLNGPLAASIPVFNNGLWDIPIQYRGEDIRILAAQTETATSSYDFAAPRQQDQLKVIGDYIAGTDYVRDDHGERVKGLKDAHYVLTGALAQRGGSHEQATELAKLLGRENPLQDSGNYLIPDQGWELIGQGRAPDQALEEFQAMAGATPQSVQTSELIWSDVQF